MTDDEVKQWLSEEERIAWNDSDNTPTPRATIGIRDALRSLAETRKALAETEFGEHCGGYDACFHCGREPARYGHKEECIFATMPRPKA